MEKSFIKVLSYLEAWKKLNIGSQQLLKEIRNDIIFFTNTFNPKIYPNNAVLDRLTYKTRITKLSKIWAEKWLEIHQNYPRMLITDLVPKIKKQINVVGFDRELISDTVETEAVLMFKEFITNNTNDVKMYMLMHEIENKTELIGSVKIERNINYAPFQFEMVSGFIYNLSFKGDEPDLDIFTQTRILKFNDLNNITDDEEIKKEIKDELRRVV